MNRIYKKNVTMYKMHKKKAWHTKTQLGLRQTQSKRHKHSQKHYSET